LTDFADGYVARRFRQESPVGRFLDPLADKLLTTAAFVAMAMPHAEFPSIPVWIAAVVVGRDLVIVFGSLIVYRRTKFKDFKPTLLGKVNTFAELGLVFWFLVFHTTGHLIFLLPWLYAIVVICVALSGGEYVLMGITILKRRN